MKIKLISLISFVTVFSVVAFASSDGGKATIKDILDSIVTKTNQLETRTAVLEEQLGIDTMDVPFGGVTRVDIQEADYFMSGNLASTTDDVFFTYQELKSLDNNGTQFDSWRNTTGNDVMVSLERLHINGTASSSFQVAVATSTRAVNTTNDSYTILKQVPVGSATTTLYTFQLGSTPFLLKAWFATSTPDTVIGRGYFGSSTSPMLVPNNGYVNLIIVNPQKACVGGANTAVVGGSGKCEAATSTTRGFDVSALLKITATTTNAIRQ